MPRTSFGKLTQLDGENVLDCSIGQPIKISKWSGSEFKVLLEYILTGTHTENVLRFSDGLLARVQNKTVEPKPKPKLKHIEPETNKKMVKSLTTARRKARKAQEEVAAHKGRERELRDREEREERARKRAREL